MIVLVRLYVREVSVKQEVATVCHDGFEDVGVLASGRNAMWR
jgi:hypothetical protein